MAVNKIAVVMVIDVCKSAALAPKKQDSFLEKSLKCASRMIERKIFAEEKDEVGIIIFGTNETQNNLASGNKYQNISVVSPLSICEWEKFETVVDLAGSDLEESHWLQALVVALDFLKSSVVNKKFREKHVLLFTNFATKVNADLKVLDNLKNAFAEQFVKLISIGVDIFEESQGREVADELPGSLSLMMNLIDSMENGWSLSFDEANEQLLYFDRRRVMKRHYGINLDIGENIGIPVNWVKLTQEDQRISMWKPAGWKKAESTNEQSSMERTSDMDTESVSSTLKYVTDDSKTAYFGSSKIPLNYSDLESIKRKTGPPDFSLICVTKHRNIHPLLLVCKDLFGVVPQKSSISKTLLSAFVDALIKAQKVGIARRVVTTNGPVKIGILLPVSDDSGKMLYFLRIPTAEWTQPLPKFRSLPETNDETCKKAVNEFIDALSLPTDLVDPGKKFLIRDPSFQLRCHILSQRAKDSNYDPDTHLLPIHIQNIMSPSESLIENSEVQLNRLKELFPLAPQFEEPKYKGKDDPSSPVRGVFKPEYREPGPSVRDLLKTERELLDKKLIDLRNENQPSQSSHSTTAEDVIRELESEMK